MSLIFQLALLAFAVLAPFYLYAFFRFHSLVKTEKPEWLTVGGSLSNLCNGLPALCNPNVQLELHRIAFGPRASQLQSPMATSYADRIRLLGCSVLAFFIIGAVGFIANAP
jgi:hypothetical protein